jgi:hypothetical protein
MDKSTPPFAVLMFVGTFCASAADQTTNYAPPQTTRKRSCAR